MARCGIRLRHPVIALVFDSSGALLEERPIGEAETLAEARRLATQAGLDELESAEGGYSRFEQASRDSPARFAITAVQP